MQYQPALGTAIHATPLITAIHAALPDARLIAAASGFALQILRRNPGLERLISTPSPLEDLSGTIKALRAAAPFGRERYAVLLTTGNERSRVMLAALLGASPNRVGFTLVPELAAAPMYYDFRISQIANNLRLLEALGHGSALLQHLQANPSLVEPAVYFSSDDLSHARTLLNEVNPHSRPLTAFVLQGSGGQQTGWHDDRFAAVIRHVEQLGHQVLFLGTSGDAATIDRIRLMAASQGVSLAGRTSVPQLAALLCLCDLLVTVDTGTLHVSRSAGLPMVVLAPSWQPMIEWMPLGLPNVRILRGPENLIEYGHVPEIYHLDEIQPQEVNQAVSELVAAYAPSAQAREARVRRLLSSPAD